MDKKNNIGIIIENECFIIKVLKDYKSLKEKYIKYSNDIYKIKDLLWYDFDIYYGVSLYIPILEKK